MSASVSGLVSLARSFLSSCFLRFRLLLILISPSLVQLKNCFVCLSSAAGFGQGAATLLKCRSGLLCRRVCCRALRCVWCLPQVTWTWGLKRTAQNCLKNHLEIEFSHTCEFLMGYCSCYYSHIFGSKPCHLNLIHIILSGVCTQSSTNGENCLFSSVQSYIYLCDDFLVFRHLSVTNLD